MKHHPISELLPETTGPAYEAIKTDIAENGLHEPIITLGGMILDGRTRWRALVDLGRESREENLVTFEGYCAERRLKDQTPLGLVRSLNVERRHLSEGQLAMFAAGMAKLGRGRPEKNSPRGDFSDDAASQAERAHFVGIGKRSVERADLVADQGVPELQDLVKSGQLGVKPAAEIASLSPARQRAEIKKGVAKLGTAAKRVTRDQRAAGLAKRQADLPEKKYGVILADFPWRFAVHDDETGRDRSAENHYPTMEIEDILRLAPRLADLAAPDCIGLFWATAPMLIEALEVIAEMEFEYKSHSIWGKDRLGTGYWFRNKHELLIVATRGNPVAPAPGQQRPSLFEAPVEGHSVKPRWPHEMVEELWPDAAKIELFARSKRRGWDVWGNESGNQL